MHTTACAAIIAFLSISFGHALNIQVAHRNLRNSEHSHGKINLTPNRSHDVGDCGIATPVTQHSDSEARCPASCPLFVDQKANGMSCDFTCVGNSVQSCKEMNPSTPVPDLERGECRHCRVVGCDQCVTDGTDTCAKCLSGWAVNRNGQCELSGIWWVLFWLRNLVGIVLLVVVVFIVWWIVDLCSREETNPEALKHAQNLRSRAKIHQPRVAGQGRKLWPWNTNLCREDVAGPSVLLLFNFQVAVIVWATVLALVWFCLGIFVDSDLAILGTREEDSLRDACINVQWGHHTMRRLMWAKIGFLEFAYLFSFGGAIIFGIRQRRLHQHHGVEKNTHSDFAAILRGLPEIPGSEKVEDKLQAAVVSSTNERPIGVSVGWQQDDSCSEIFEVAIASRSIDVLKSVNDTVIEQKAVDPTEAEKNMSWYHKVFIHFEEFFVKPSTQRMLARGRHKTGKRYKQGSAPKSSPQSMLTDDEEPQESPRSSSPDEDDVKEAINSLKTSSVAFVVFETQHARDNAVTILDKTPMEFEGKTLRVEVPDFEPSAVIWRNLAPERTMKDEGLRVLKVLCFIAMMVGLLSIFEYWYYNVQLNAVIATGHETMTVGFIVATLSVAGMMAVLCVLSAEVAERAAVERVGARETVFVLLYAFSVILQVTLDLVIAYWIGKHLMEEHDVRTYEGKKLADMNTETNFVDIFETYAMQKQLGVTVLSFGFPCAFLIPFLIEPIVSIYLPYQIMKLIIQSHPEITKHTAEGYLEAVPMDLGRYGDIIINVFVGSLILWFPGGFTFQIFAFLACSHVYIYCLDQWRMLKCVQTVYISSFSVDWWAQWMFGVACSIIAAALVFKANCESESVHLFVPTPVGSHCDDGLTLVFKVLCAFFGHLLVHTIMLLWIVPLFSGSSSTEAKESVAQKPYRETAMAYPCSWFSANMIHCLRSEYVYEHDPPFDYCVSGKEHHMRVNKDIGAFFSDGKAEMESYDTISPKQISRRLSRFIGRDVPDN